MSALIGGSRVRGTKQDDAHPHFDIFLNTGRVTTEAFAIGVR